MNFKKILIPKEIIVIFLILTIFVGLYHLGGNLTGFAVFSSSSQSDFNEGTYDQTVYSESGFVQLDVNYTGGVYTSKIFDADYDSIWNNIDWAGETAENESLIFQIRVCSLPDCSDSEFSEDYSNSPVIVNLTGRYFQYKADFSTDDVNNSPKLYDVTIDYTILVPENNSAPSIPVLNFPEDNVNISMDSVLLNSTVNDPDNDLLTIWFYGDDSIINTIENVASGSIVTYDWSAFEGGIHNWYVKVGDGSYNTSSDIYSFNYVVLNSAPSIPVLNFPEDDAEILVNYTLLNATVSDPDGDDITVWFYDDGDDSIINTIENVASGSIVTYDWEELEEDDYDWYVKVGDGSYNTSSDIYSFDIVLESDEEEEEEEEEEEIPYTEDVISTTTSNDETYEDSTPEASQEETTEEETMEFSLEEEPKIKVLVGKVSRKITNFVTGFIVTDNFASSTQKIIGLIIIVTITVVLLFYFAFLSKNCWFKRKKLEKILDKKFQFI